MANDYEALKARAFAGEDADALVMLARDALRRSDWDTLHMAACSLRGYQARDLLADPRRTRFLEHFKLRKARFAALDFFFKAAAGQYSELVPITPHEICQVVILECWRIVAACERGRREAKSCEAVMKAYPYSALAFAGWIMEASVTLR